MSNKLESFIDPLISNVNSNGSQILSPLILALKKGIYDADLMSKRRLKDKVVLEALKKLLEMIKSNSSNDLDLDPKALIDDYSALVIWNLRRAWIKFSEKELDFKEKDFLLSLIELQAEADKWNKELSYSRGFLEYIERFISSVYSSQSLDVGDVSDIQSQNVSLG